MSMKSFYEESTEQKMKAYYSTLAEKAARHYASVEALKLGYGGISYISRLFGIHRNVVYKGMKELSIPSLMEQIPPGKQRRTGGGRKKKKKK